MHATGQMINNIETQTNNHSDWPNRSLVYLCREFDSLSHGELYENLKPVYQVSFIDFRLFSDHPEFFGKYQMRNALDGYLYNSNFNLYVIELNSTDIATDDDIRSGMVTWVKLFKATTWEGARYPEDICSAPTEVKRRHQDDH